MNTLVVGSDGTLGCILVDRLGVRGVRMRCADWRAEAPAEIAQADVVVNVAGPRVRPGLGWADYMREHVGVTSAIARTMRAGTRLVHVSSTAVYGARGERLGLQSPEAPTLFPSSAYACAKLAAENAARAIARARGVAVRVLRPSMVYGPGVESALETVRKLARRGLRLRLAPGDVRQHLLHVDLLVRAVDRAAVAALAPDEAPLLVADPFVLTNADVVCSGGSSSGARLPLAIDVRAMSSVHRALSRTGLELAPAALEALAVLGLDNTFDVAPTWRALGVDPAQFARERTFDRYWFGAAS